MAPQETEVISALNLLCNTPGDILNAHRHLALQTLVQIGRLLNTSRNENEHLLHGIDVEHGNGSSENAVIPKTVIPQTDASSEIIDLPVHAKDSINLPVTVSGSEPAVLSKTNSSENTTKKRKRETIRESPFAKLTRLVAKRLPNIIQFCESKASLSDILQNEQELQFADKRVDHLKQVDGNKTPSEEQKLLKGLSQLSLAEQFTAWEIENGWKSRVDTLYDEIRVARTEGQNGTVSARCAGKMTRFVREHGYPESDHNVVRKGIQRGITQILFLRSMEEVSTTPIQKRATRGILALVTIFEAASFQTISNLELQALGEALLKGNEGDKTLMLVHDVSKWFENMTGDFKMISQTTKRGRRDPLQTTHAPSHVPSINSHELTTFSTLPRVESNSQGMPLHPSLIEFQARPGGAGMLPNAGSHDLAQFSRNTTNANCVLTGNPNPYSESHELSLFSRGPSSVSAQSQLPRQPLCSSFPSDVSRPSQTFRQSPTPHEGSSIPTIPA
ncbi:unnamed protein product [Aspergillus oryzae var. brunneus]|uniref:Unnamed protein product n=2 Tax=Aspergillus oryzae TaxID=5062 RepID=A0A1S9DX64_ASPOZ|nr:hypothetical protein OAory_01013930 [Aspergillus oryzae]GMG16856.1 unnamed protein product [Aspergillus oryzae]GMG38407.1 unnamed protein product [Aspergillus oryzae]GMG55362.1 unnamed protein product [Aspergillus oryzae var. brunneus]